MYFEIRGDSKIINGFSIKGNYGLNEKERNVIMVLNK